jgi:hypothetical protein
MPIPMSASPRPLCGLSGSCLSVVSVTTGKRSEAADRCRPPRLTVIHELEGAPKLAERVPGLEDTGASGGWARVLSGLKSVLETGKPLAR